MKGNNTIGDVMCLIHCSGSSSSESREHRVKRSTEESDKRIQKHGWYSV